MNILGLYAEDYPWDVRIEKVLGGLARRGHHVDLVCRNLKRSASREEVDGMVCHRVLDGGLPHLLHATCTIPASFNPLWQQAVRRILAPGRKDLVVVRDLPLAPLAIREAHRHGIPCVVDMAENHPEMWRDVGRHDRWKLPSLILKNPDLGKLMERHTVRHADMIFVVVEEMRDYLLSLGGDPERIKIVSNTPDLQKYEQALEAPPLPVQGDTLDLVYAGFVSTHRGLDQALPALARLRDMRPLPRLHIVGSGSHVSALRHTVQRLGIASQVLFHGWVEHARLNQFIAPCHVGLVPHLKTGHTDHTIPNKIFDYMAQAKPVLVSNARPLERLVQEVGCGLVFTDGDSADLARQIQALADADRRREMGLAGRRAVFEQHHWAADFDVIIQTLERTPLTRRSAAPLTRPTTEP